MESAMLAVFIFVGILLLVGLGLLLREISSRVLPPNQQFGDSCGPERRERNRRPPSAESVGALEKMQRLRRQR